MENKIITIKLVGTAGNAVEKAKIRWVETRDLLGPTEEFPITSNHGSYKAQLPGNGLYLFSISAAGYEQIVHHRIDVTDETRNAEIVMHEK
jgi:hypothetical protein